MCEVYLSHADIEGNIYIQIQGPGLLELDVLNSEVSETLSKVGISLLSHRSIFLFTC